MFPGRMSRSETIDPQNQLQILDFRDRINTCESLNKLQPLQQSDESPERSFKYLPSLMFPPSFQLESSSSFCCDSNYLNTRHLKTKLITDLFGGNYDNQPGEIIGVCVPAFSSLSEFCLGVVDT